MPHRTPHHTPYFTAENLHRANADDAFAERLKVQAFGQTLSILAPKIDFLRADSLWRLHHIYQPALATQTLAAEGVALDIGAGFGVFALPFALAYPGWRVFCFEPNLIAFHVLQRNIQELALTQITALPFAIGPEKADAPQDSVAMRMALEKLAAGEGDAVDGLSGLLPLATFSKSKINIGYLEYGCNVAAEFDQVQVPTLPAAMLDTLNPNLLKLIAPKVEAEILSNLSTSRIDHVIGESWGHISSACIQPPAAGQRQTWMPRAGQPKLALRRWAVSDGRQSRLDVIVDLSDENGDFSGLSALLSDPSDDIKILAIGPESAARQDFVHADPRISFFTAPHQGQSAAWNFGRLQSTATHLAFVDGQTLPDKSFFSRLFDLARQTGAEVVQGPYHLNGVERSPETNPTQIPHFEFADTTYQRLNAAALMKDPPAIWRRVYRRDFLDNRAIWFSPDLGPLAHFAFQTLSLNYLPDVPELSGVEFIHHGSPQDDAYFTLDAFKMLLERAKVEGWHDLSALSQSFVAQANRTIAHMRPQERSQFIQSAAKFTAALNNLATKSVQAI